MAKNPNEDMQKMNDTRAVVTDAQLEAEEFPIGRTVHISTITHAFRGTLAQVTPSHYILKKGTCMIIHDTGAVKEYSKGPDMKPDEGEVVACQVRIPRASVAWELTFDK